ncbi:hypothetical protein ZWY2020_023765 [Hordeum vulgare]|nr:hypothetical protein ZWY2020_023765 [Hordeum vulgare]
MESIAADVLREILLKLPAKDVACCRCVSRRWRCIIGDSSFYRLHAVSGSGPETLLVSHGTLLGKGLQNTVLLSVSSTKPMPTSRIEVAGGDYHPASVCNGFVVLASERVEIGFNYGYSVESLYVWNPVTGEKLRVPAPSVQSKGWHLFAMGFSGVSHPYKLFRLPFRGVWTDDNHLDVYTLGDSRGWRRLPDPVPRYWVHWAGSPPTLVDGKLYVLTKRSKWYPSPPDRVLVIDVASEAYRMYRLMEGYWKTDAVAVMDAFELAGRLCVAVC